MRSCMRSRCSSTRLRSARSVRPSASPEYNTQRATCTACHGSPVATWSDAPQHVPATHDRTAGTGPCGCFVVASWLCLNGCDGHSYCGANPAWIAASHSHARTHESTRTHGLTYKLARALLRLLHTHPPPLPVCLRIPLVGSPEPFFAAAARPPSPLCPGSHSRPLQCTSVRAARPIRLDSIGCKCSTARTVSTVLRWCGGLSVLMIRSAAADSQPAGEGSDHRRRGARAGLPLLPLCTHCLLP